MAVDEPCDDVNQVPQLEPTKISKSILIRSDLHWVVCVNGKVANNSPTLSSIPKTLSLESFRSVVDIVHRSKICTGFANKKYVDMCREKKGTLYSSKRKGVAAFLHEGYPIAFGDAYTYATVRHTLITLCGHDRCASCNGYQPTLKAMYSYFKKHSSTTSSTPHSKSNIRFFSTPVRLRQSRLLRQSLYMQKRKVKRLDSRLELATAQEGIELHDDDLQGVVDGFQSDIDLMNEDDFRKIFWTQQVTIYTVHTCIHVHVHYCLQVL